MEACHSRSCAVSADQTPSTSKAPAPGWKRSTAIVALSCARAALAQRSSAAIAALRRRRSAKAASSSKSGQPDAPVELQPAPATTQTPGSLCDLQAPEMQMPPLAQSESRVQELRQALAPQT